jgi:hypothetical protein
MSHQHADLAAGRWKELPFLEQMANIGSEVERAQKWRTKNNPEYSEKALERALELIDLAIEYSSTRSRLRELVRMREALVDYFFGANEFGSTEASWRRYFSHFTVAVRRNT